MEVALRRRLDGVKDISISQSEQTAEVTFTEGDRAFSPGAFREAVGEAGVKVLVFQIDVCGVIKQEGQQMSLVAGKNRWPVTGAGSVSLDKPLCVSGRLDDSTRPPHLQVLEIKSAPK
jgi:hypothetical protein